MKKFVKNSSSQLLFIIMILFTGFLLGSFSKFPNVSMATEPKANNNKSIKSVGKSASPGTEPYGQIYTGSDYMKQSPGGYAAIVADNEFGLGDSHVSRLLPYPQLKDGERTPFDLWKYAGRDESSWNSPKLPMPWDEWVQFHRNQKPKLMTDVREYMNSRFDMNGRVIPNVKMSGGEKKFLSVR